MKPRVIAAFVAAVLSTAGGRGADVTASGLTLPFFDETGRMTHRLIAKRATVTGVIRHMEDVEVSYFSPQDKDRVIQRLEATEATWDDAKGILTGTGTVVVTSEATQLSGTGFVFSLAKSALEIQHDFKLTDSDFVLTSDRATVDLEIEKKGDELRVRDANRCEARGHLHIITNAAARTKYHFDEAFSENAIYDGRKRVITFPNEVRFLADGGESTSKTIAIKLDEKPPKP